MEAALRDTLTFRSGPDGRNRHLWSGSSVGLKDRSPLSAAGKGLSRRLETVCRRFYSSHSSLGKPGPFSSWRNGSVAYSPNPTEPPASSFTTYGAERVAA
jgi:hypothetical protein